MYFEDKWSDSRYDANIGINKTGNRLLDYFLCTINDNHREKERNRRFNRFNTMGRLKKYNIYKFETKDGKFYDNGVRVNKRSESLKKLISTARTKGFEEAGLPLPVNKYSKPVGVIRDDMTISNNRRPRVYERDYVVADWLTHSHPELLESMTDNEIKIFGGDWRYTIQNIHTMCSDVRDYSYRYDELIDGYFSRAGIDLILPKLNNYSSDYILGLPINPNAGSGHLTSRLVSKKRRISTMYTKEASKYYADEIMNRKEFTVDKSLTSIGGREKRIKIKLDENKKYKTRAINNPEDIPTLISQSVAKPINETLQKINDGFNYGGRINGSRNFLTYLKDMECDTDMININPDISEHDGSVKEENVVTAMALLRCCYPECEKIDRLFIYIVSSAIYKRLVLPESGLVYEVSKGLATGHGLTSILTTLVAYGTISVAINKTHSHNDIQRTIIRNAGDDITAKVLTRKLTDIYNVTMIRSGFIMDDVRDYCGYFNSTSPDMQTTFLKKSYNNGMFCWNHPELMANLLTPTIKGSKFFFGTITSNLKQMIYQAPLNDKLNNELLNILVMQTLYRLSKSGVKKDFGIYCTNYERYLSGLARTGRSIVHPRIILKDIDFINVMQYSSDFRTHLRFDVKRYLLSMLDDIDNTIIAKKLWFMRYIRYEQHRKTLRLAIFDIGKRNTKPRGYYLTKYNNIKWD